MQRGGKTGVLFISSAEEPGADTFIHMLLMRTLDRSRFDVHVAYSAGQEDARTPAHEVLRHIPELTLRPTNFGPSLTLNSPAGTIARSSEVIAAVAGLVGLSRYVRRHRIQVVHSTDRPRDAVACAIVGKLSSARSIIHAHLKCADWMGRSVRWSMRQVDALVGVSEFVVQSMIDKGYASDRAHAVLNAIDLPAWDYRTDGSQVRTEFGIPAAAPVIVCAARLFRGKGQDTLLRALPIVRSEFPDVRVLIVGRDDLLAMKESFTAELQAMVAELELGGNVHFTGQRSDMAAVMAACDLFVLPSFEEPFGLVYAEAMAMKKPVIANNHGGAPEVIDHGLSGLLTPPRDTTGLADNILTLLRDPALRARMGEYGRKQVEQRFTAQRMALDTARIYDALSSNARRPDAQGGVTLVDHPR